jgi:AcrR family transcriptional regulator
MPKIVTEADRQLKRQVILDAAAHEIARIGYDRANINTIAEQAGIGRGTIYLYFKSKEEVLEVLLDSVGQLINEVIQQSIEQHGTWQYRLELLAQTFMELASDHRDYLRVHVSALHGVNRPIGAPVARWLKTTVSHLAFAFERAAERGQIRTSDPFTLALLVLAMLESFVLLPEVLDLPIHEAVARSAFMAEVLWGGIRPLHTP